MTCEQKKCNNSLCGGNGCKKCCSVPPEERTIKADDNIETSEYIAKNSIENFMNGGIMTFNSYTEEDFQALEKIFKILCRHKKTPKDILEINFGHGRFLLKPVRKFNFYSRDGKNSARKKSNNTLQNRKTKRNVKKGNGR